jgi:hypothetical protein
MTDNEVNLGAPSALETSEPATQENIEETIVVEEPAETTPESQAPEEQAKKKVRKSGWERKLFRAEREAADLRAELAALRVNREQPQQEQARQSSNDKPDVGNYETYEDYQEALTDWKVEQKLAAREQKIEKQKVEQTWKQKVEEARKTHDDYEDVIADIGRFPIKKILEDAVINSDSGPELAYYLGKNPKLLTELNNASPVTMYRELGKIEASILGSPNVSKPAAKRTTNAPPPITPVKAVASTVTDLASMSNDDYAALRLKKLSAGRS